MEKNGNLYSGVNRSIVLTYCEDLEESYSNCRIKIELLRLDELDRVIAAYYNLLIILGESLLVFILYVCIFHAFIWRIYRILLYKDIRLLVTK